VLQPADKPREADRPADAPADKPNQDPGDARARVQTDRTQLVSLTPSQAGAGASPQDSSDDAVVVVVGENQWTLASADVQALDELERVLALMRSTKAIPYLTTGNYSMYLLRRASASDVLDTLEKLLQPAQASGGRRSSSSSAAASQVSELARRATIVADIRTNSLIVSGNPNERQLIEELLGVLDSDEMIGSLQQLLPTTILLKSADASQVETILKVIYRAQLATSSSRKPIPIPESVSSDVATLLQQLNAESASPLLTMTADKITNSIIVRATLEMTDEIRRFVESLDNQTANTPSLRVDMIQLKSTNTQSIEAALKRLMAK
jgi:type II secretory pathway component GspD/PulD (secretin)